VARKPEHQWETRLHRAVGEELRFFDGRVGRIELSLRRQVVDDASADDPDLPHAVRCWLAARGARRANLVTDSGRLVDGAVFTVADLGGFEGAARRLVTLAPSNAEVVEALGCFPRVVACEDSSDHPPGVASLPRLGPDLGPDLDAVQQLQPDLVVSSLTVPGMERVVTGLRARGIPQLVLAPRSYADVVAEIARVGAALGVAERAAAVVADMKRQRAELEARAGASVRVYLEWWPKPMFTPGADCYSNELVALGGGVNVFGDRPGSSLQVTPAEVLEAAPDICFVSWCGVAEEKLDPENLRRRPGLEALEAPVYRLDERFSGRPGPRMLEASRRIAAAIADAGLR
jgi:iron complex transport system substrate-binding protein